MDYSSDKKSIIQLIDLPDESILSIMNKVKPHLASLCSIIGIGNNRLKQLALDSCNRLDLTYDYFQYSYKSILKRLYTHVIPRIITNIRSLILDIQHLPDMMTFTQKSSETFCKLKYLKFMFPTISVKTDAYHTLGSSLYSILRGCALYSVVPELIIVNEITCEKIFSAFRCSLLMHSIMSFELDDTVVLSNDLISEELYFPQSIQLTHIQITLYRFDQRIRLLHQLGSQLQSFIVNILHIEFFGITRGEITSISYSFLKELTIIIYRNIVFYEQCLVPLLQRQSNVEYLTLLLAIGLF